MALGRREFLGEAVAGVVALALPEEPPPQAAALSRRAASGPAGGRAGTRVPPAHARLQLAPARLQHALRRHSPRRRGAAARHARRPGRRALGRPLRHPPRIALRRPQLRGLLDDRPRRGGGPAAPARRPGLERPGDRRAGHAADRRLLAPRPQRAARPRRLVPERRRCRPGPGRRPRPLRAEVRPDLRQPARRHDRDRRRPRPARRPRHERGPLLGLPRRRRGQLRHRHVAHAAGAPDPRRGVVHHPLPLEPGERGARRVAALRARRAARAHLGLQPRHHRRRRRSERHRRRPVLRPGGAAAEPDRAAGARERGERVGRHRHHDGPGAALVGRRRPGPLPGQVGLLRRAAAAARPRADDRVDRAPPARALAGIRRAAARLLRRSAQPAPARRRRRSCTATCSSRSST